MEEKDRRNLYTQLDSVLLTLKRIQQADPLNAMVKAFFEQPQLHSRVEALFVHEQSITEALAGAFPLFEDIMREIRNSYITVVIIVYSFLRDENNIAFITQNSFARDAKRQIEEKIDLFWFHLVFRPFFAYEALPFLKTQLNECFTKSLTIISPQLQNAAFETVQVRLAESLEEVERSTILGGEDFLRINQDKVRNVTLKVAEFLRMVLFLSKGSPEFARLATRENVFKHLCTRLLLWTTALSGHVAAAAELASGFQKEIEEARNTAIVFVNEMFRLIDDLYLSKKNRKSKIVNYYEEHLHKFFLAIVKWMNMNEYEKRVVFRTIKLLLRNCLALDDFLGKMSKGELMGVEEFEKVYAVIARFKEKMSVEDKSQMELERQKKIKQDQSQRAKKEQDEKEEVKMQKKNEEFIRNILKHADAKKERFKVVERDIYDDEFDDTFDQAAPPPPRPARPAELKKISEKPEEGEEAKEVDKWTDDDKGGSGESESEGSGTDSEKEREEQRKRFVESRFGRKQNQPPAKKPDAPESQSKTPADNKNPQSKKFMGGSGR